MKKILYLLLLILTLIIYKPIEAFSNNWPLEKSYNPPYQISGTYGDARIGGGWTHGGVDIPGTPDEDVIKMRQLERGYIKKIEIYDDNESGDIYIVENENDNKAWYYGHVKIDTKILDAFKSDDRWINKGTKLGTPSTKTRNNKTRPLPHVHFGYTTIEAGASGDKSFINPVEYLIPKPAIGKSPEIFTLSNDPKFTTPPGLNFLYYKKEDMYFGALTNRFLTNIIYGHVDILAKAKNDMNPDNVSLIDVAGDVPGIFAIDYAVEGSKSFGPLKFTRFTGEIYLNDESVKALYGNEVGDEAKGYQVSYKVTNTNKDINQNWNTRAKDAGTSGYGNGVGAADSDCTNSYFPDGEYTVKVTAYGPPIHGDQTTKSDKIIVDNCRPFVKKVIIKSSNTQQGSNAYQAYYGEWGSTSGSLKLQQFDTGVKIIDTEAGVATYTVSLSFSEPVKDVVLNIDYFGTIFMQSNPDTPDNREWQGTFTVTQYEIDDDDGFSKVLHIKANDLAGNALLNLNSGPNETDGRKVINPAEELARQKNNNDNLPLNGGTDNAHQFTFKGGAKIIDADFAPPVLTAAAGNGFVNLSWTYDSSQSLFPLLFYEIQKRDSTSDGNWETVGLIFPSTDIYDPGDVCASYPEPETFTYVDNLINYNFYEFRVAALHLDTDNNIVSLGADSNTCEQNSQTYYRSNLSEYVLVDPNPNSFEFREGDPPSDYPFPDYGGIIDGGPAPTCEDMCQSADGSPIEKPEWMNPSCDRYCNEKIGLSVNKDKILFASDEDFVTIQGTLNDYNSFQSCKRNYGHKVEYNFYGLVNDHYRINHDGFSVGYNTTAWEADNVPLEFGYNDITAVAEIHIYDFKSADGCGCNGCDWGADVLQVYRCQPMKIKFEKIDISGAVYDSVNEKYYADWNDFAIGTKLVWNKEENTNCYSPPRVYFQVNDNEKIEIDYTTDTNPDTFSANLNISPSLNIGKNIVTFWAEYDDKLKANTITIHGGSLTVYRRVPELDPDKLENIMDDLGRPVDPNALVMDTINVVNGNVLMHPKDSLLYLTGKGFDLDFFIAYNSGSTYGKRIYDPLGVGWTHSFDVRPYHRKPTQDIEGFVKLSLHNREGTNEQVLFRAVMEGVEEKFISLRGYRGFLVPYENAQYLLTHTDGLKYIFSSDFQLLSIQDHNGNSLTIDYELKQLGTSWVYKATTVTHSNGRGIVLEYHTSGEFLGKLNFATDTFGRKVSFSYITVDCGSPSEKCDYNIDNPNDPENPQKQVLLNKVTYADGSETAFEYNNHISNQANDSRVLTAMIDRNGRRTEWGYTHWTYVYKDKDGVSQTGERDSCNSFSLEEGVHKRIIRGYGTEEVNGETRNINWREVEDSLGNVTTFLFDEKALIKEIRDPEGNTEYYNWIWDYAWKDDYQFNYTIDKKGLKTTYINYDMRGRPMRIFKNPGNTPNAAITYTFNLDQIESYTDPNGNVTLYNYYFDQNNIDQYKRPKSIIDPDGKVTQFLEYKGGDLKHTVGPNGGNGFRYEYNNNGSGDISSVTNPLGETIQFTYTYSSTETVITMTGASVPTGTVVYRYNLFNRLKEISYADATSVKYIRDNEDVTIIDRDGRETFYEFDNAYRLKSVTYSDGTILSYDYDKESNITKKTDQNMKEVGYEYDKLGRIKIKRYPDGAVWEYKYDVNGNMISIIDPKKQITSFGYDILGRLTKRMSPDEGTIIYDYDSADNLIRQVNADGVNIVYTYDKLNRLTGVNEISDTPQNIAFYYDSTSVANGKGKLTKMEDSAGVTEFHYDILGRLKHKDALILGKHYITSYGYDESGNIKKITYPTGNKTTYTYDTDNRVKTVKAVVGGEEEVVISDMTYLSSGYVLTVTYGNGFTTTFDYDGGHPPFIGPANVRTDPPYLNKTYGYDLTGNILSIVDTVDPASNQNFLYDSWYQPVLAQGSYGEMKYSYDLNGNRTKKIFNDTTTLYSYDPGNNRLISDGGSGNYSYDSGGRLIRDGTRKFSYDYDNHLTGVIDGITQTGEYLYNGKGNRVVKVNEFGDRTIYHYDQDNRLIAETDSFGELIALYIYAGDTLIAKIDNDEETPEPPQNVTAVDTMQGGEAKIVWDASPEPDIAKFRVFRRDIGKTAYTLIGSPVKAEFIDIGLTDKKTYCYSIKAVDTAGNKSGFSQDGCAAISDKVFSKSYASPKGGLYTPLNISVTLTADDSSSTIYYTIDGKEPISYVSPKYSEPVNITQRTELRFFSVDTSGNRESPTNIEIYAKTIDTTDTTIDTDGDGIPDVEEVTLGTNPYNPDTDGDGLKDKWEKDNGFNPVVINQPDQDSDEDGIPDKEEQEDGTNPNSGDTDGDGIPDEWENAYGLDPLNDDSSYDYDEDRLTNIDEYQYYTDPYNADTDVDGMPDGWEAENSLSPAVVDAGYDPDSDSLVNIDEYNNETDPNNPDTDSDLMPDGWEVRYGLNPLENDAAGNIDGDFYTNLQEYNMGSDPADRSSPAVPDIPVETDDRDSDEMPNNWEVFYGLNPDNPADAGEDNDVDELSNLDEYKNFTNPLNKDTDNDWMPDGWEVNNRLNPIVSDWFEDPDNDGFSNLKEYLKGTDPQNTASYPVSETNLSSKGGTYHEGGDKRSSPSFQIMDAAGQLITTDKTGASQSTGNILQAGFFTDIASTGTMSKDTSIVEAVPEYILSDGVDTTSIKVIPKDGYGINIGDGQSLSISTTSGTLTGAAVYAGNGIYTQTLQSSNTPETALVTATINGVVINDTAYVVFIVPDDDPDNDGLTNAEELAIGTDPFDYDSDDDLIPDKWELDNGSNPLDSSDAKKDTDSDGVTQRNEYISYLQIKIDDLSIADMGETWVTLSWTAPGRQDMRGIALAYDIRYSREPVTDDIWGDPEKVIECTGEPTPASAGTVQSYTVTGLEEGVKYYFGIRVGE